MASPSLYQCRASRPRLVRFKDTARYWRAHPARARGMGMPTGLNMRTRITEMLRIRYPNHSGRHVVGRTRRARVCGVQRGRTRDSGRVDATDSGGSAS
jgi:hypothetical protein